MVVIMIMIMIMILMTIVMRGIRVARCGGIGHPGRRFRACPGDQGRQILMTVVMVLVVVMSITVMAMMVVAMVIMAVIVGIVVSMIMFVVVMLVVTMSRMHIVVPMRGFGTVEVSFKQLRPGWMKAGLIIGFGIAVFGHLVLGCVLAGRRFRASRPAGVGSLHDIALDPFAMTATTRIAMPRAPPGGAVLGLFFGFAMGAFFGLDQGLTVCHRNLVVVGMDFAEGKKTVTVATVFDEGRLQRRLYPRDLGEVDVAPQLFALGGLEIKLFDTVATDHNDPGLFRVGGVDQHFVWHF